MAALVFCDGFDRYGPANTAMTTNNPMIGDWSLSGTISALYVTAGLSSPGYALKLENGNATMTGNFPSSLTRIAGSVRFSNGTSANRVFLSFFNFGTAACSFWFSGSGGIEFHIGTSASVIATGGSVQLNTTHVLSFDITIGSSAAYAVYLDGVLLYSGTGNTGNTQTSVNSIILTSNTVYIYTVDDLVIYDATHTNYNSAILTAGVVIETQFPSSDNQTQFNNDGNAVWPQGIASKGIYSSVSPAINNTIAANQLFLLKVVPVVNCNINTVSIMPGSTGSIAKHKAVLYSDNAGNPGSLISSGTEVVGTTNGTPLTGLLLTPTALTAGTAYWIGFIGDTSVTYRQIDSTTNLGRKLANTYTSGAPAGPLGAMTASQPTWWIWANCTGATVNWATVGMNPPDPFLVAYTHSGTVGQEDLFNFPVLLTTPSAIYGSAVKAYVAKSDSGLRTISINMKSGSVDSTGSNPNQSMGTTMVWQRSFFDLDPNTGVAWTASGINAARSGITVAS